MADGDTTTATGGSITTLPTDPTRAGYTFTGWYTAASGGTQITAGAAHGQTADFTVYPNGPQTRLRDLLTVKAAGPMATRQLLRRINNHTANRSDPSRLHLYWLVYTAASGGTQITAGAAHGQTADFTLYAQWAANTLERHL